VWGGVSVVQRCAIFFFGCVSPATELYCLGSEWPSPMHFVVVFPFEA